MRGVRALVSYPPRGGVELRDVPAPTLSDGQARVRVVEVGLCGTDLEIVAGHYGKAPGSDPYLVLGHENLGVVAEVQGSGAVLAPGTLVVATVRRGCGACAFCRAGRSDFCSTGRYTERGIWGAHGYLAEEYVESVDQLIEVPGALRTCAVLLEPFSVVEKAIEQGFGVLARENPPPEAGAEPPKALVAGAGAIGLLASLLLRLRGWSVTTLDRHGEETSAAAALRRAGAAHVNVSAGLGALGGARFGLIVEATGSSTLDEGLLDLLAPNGAIVLTGIPDANDPAGAPMGARLRRLVLQNQAVVGSVNANRNHFRSAAADLAELARRWPGLPEGLIGERRPWGEYAELFGHRGAGTIKSVLAVGDP